MLTMTLSPDIQAIVRRIEKQRQEPGPLAPEVLMPLFTARERDSILNAVEAAIVASAMADRPISTDYIKRLRLTKRLRAKKVNERAYVFLLGDVLGVEFRGPYEQKPPGRPRKHP